MAPMTAREAAFNPVLLELPDRIETARLLVRAPRLGDAPTVYASVVEALEEMRRFPASMNWAMEEPAVQESEEFCRQGAANWLLRTDFPMLIFRRDNGAHIGNGGLHRFN
jgi:hypothetical protein